MVRSCVVKQAGECGWKDSESRGQSDHVVGDERVWSIMLPQQAKWQGAAETNNLTLVALST